MRFIPEKIKRLCINPYTEDVNPKDHFRCIYHNVAGGVISGNASNLIKLSELYEDTWIRMLSDNWYQFDEAVMTMISKSHPDLFDDYYGDYENIICGYDIYSLSDIKNFNLCISAVNKFLNKMMHREAYRVLKYIEPYCLQFSNTFDTYLRLYLICKYYVSEDKVIESHIMDMMLKPPVDLKKISTLENVRYYTNFIL